MSQAIATYAIYVAASLSGNSLVQERDAGWNKVVADLLARSIEQAIGRLNFYLDPSEGWNNDTVSGMDQMYWFFSYDDCAPIHTLYHSPRFSLWDHVVRGCRPSCSIIDQESSC